MVIGTDQILIGIYEKINGRNKLCIKRHNTSPSERLGILLR